jgi:hypothetical protein
MFIYNVTCKVAWSIHDAWLQWMREEHIPHVEATGCFLHSKMLRLLDIDDTEGPTYAIQYTAATLEQFRKYEKVYAASLRKEVTDRWGEAYIAFRTLMQELS